MVVLHLEVLLDEFAHGPFAHGKVRGLLRDLSPRVPLHPLAHGLDEVG